jgi:hypothetical protein
MYSYLALHPKLFSVVYYNSLVSLSKEKGVGVGGFGEGLDGTLNDFVATILFHFI